MQVTMSESLQRIGLIGDVHAEDEILASALALFAELGVDGILSVGDIADGYGDINRACDLLQQHSVIGVRGNHDRWLLTDEMRQLSNAHRVHELSDSSRAFLQQLPTTLSLETTRGRALLCHGVDDDDMIRLRPDHEGYAIESNMPLQRLLRQGTYRLMFNGHTHRMMVRDFDGLTVINAGTLHRDYDVGVVVVDIAQWQVTPFWLLDRGDWHTDGPRPIG